MFRVAPAPLGIPLHTIKSWRPLLSVHFTSRDMRTRVCESERVYPPRVAVTRVFFLPLWVPSAYRVWPRVWWPRSTTHSFSPPLCLSISHQRSIKFSYHIFTNITRSTRASLQGLIGWRAAAPPPCAAHRVRPPGGKQRPSRTPWASDHGSGTPDDATRRSRTAGAAPASHLRADNRATAEAAEARRGTVPMQGCLQWAIARTVAGDRWPSG